MKRDWWLLFVVGAGLAVSPAQVAGQQVLLDEPVEAGELTLYPVLGDNLEPGLDHYYVPDRARLAVDDRGQPQFSFLRYVDNVRPGEGEEVAREGEGGGIVHAVVQLDVEESALRAAESALGRLRPGARIVGPVTYRSGTFGLVSSFLEEDGELSRRVVGLGAAPVLEGGRAAISMRLTKLGSKILWESFEMAQPDISFLFEMEIGGLRAPLQAQLEADWDRIYGHQVFQAAVAAPVLAGEVSAAFDNLRSSGAIRLVQVGDDAQMEKLVQVAYDKLATLMLEPAQGTGMPSLGQLASGARGGGLLDRATRMLQTARAEAGERTPAAAPVTSAANRERAPARAADEPESAATSSDDPGDPASRQNPDEEAIGGAVDAANQTVAASAAAGAAAQAGVAESTTPSTDAAATMSQDRRRAYMMLIWERKLDYLETEVLPNWSEWADEMADPVDCATIGEGQFCEDQREIWSLMQSRLAEDLVPGLRSYIGEGNVHAVRDLDPALRAEIAEDVRVEELGDAWGRRTMFRGYVTIQQEAIDSLTSWMNDPGSSTEQHKGLQRLLDGWKPVLGTNEEHLAETIRSAAELQAEIGLTAEFPDVLEPTEADPWLEEQLGVTVTPTPDPSERGTLDADAARPEATAADPSAAGLSLIDDPGGASSITDDELWIVSLGDSFSSGEGNPTTTGVPINAWKWMDDEKCHRSKWGWPHVVTEDIAEHTNSRVRLTFLACSGGMLKEGLLESFTERGVDREPQLDRLKAMIEAAGRVPDAVLMTGGGNDMGFADIVIECISPGNCPGGEATDSLDARIGRLGGPDGLYADVDKRLEEMGVESDRVVLLMYPDPLVGRKRDGPVWGPNVVQAGCYIPAGPRMWSWASENVVVRLQNLQRERAAALGWRLADNHQFEFQKHSYCPRISFRGGDSWWVGILAQIVKQWGLGAFHPNRRGHRELARSAMLELAEFLPGLPKLAPRTEEPSVGPGGSEGTGGPGAGGGGGGRQAGASGSRPSVSVVAALQLRKSRQQGTFRLDMSKYMAGSQVVNFAQPIGDLTRYKDDESVFRQVNLDQPLFRQREVAFRLDGLNAQDFGEYVNFVHVQLRRGEAVREELTVGADEFNDRGNDFRLIYGFSDEESRDEWARYEYRTVWSLFGGLTVEQPWRRDQDGTVALTPPYVRRAIELEGDPETLEGVRAITVRLYYAAGDEERYSEALLRPELGGYVGTADVLLPVGEAEYEYEITWHYGSQRTLTSGRQLTSQSILFLDLPQE